MTNKKPEKKCKNCKRLQKRNEKKKYYYCNETMSVFKDENYMKEYCEHYCPEK